MPPTKVEKARMNNHLRAHGLGDMADKTILDQLAFFIRSHKTFQDMLMKVAPAERNNAYKAIAPRLNFFKPKSLEDYEIAAKREAENLPIYDNKTLAITMPNDPIMSDEMKTAITGKTLEERRQTELLEKAEDAIAEDLGQERAKGRLHISCKKCTFETLVYATDRMDAYLTLNALGWHVAGDDAYCPDCKPATRDNN